MLGGFRQGRGGYLKALRPKDRSSWRRWLSANCETEEAVWLVFPKVSTGRESIAYDEAVEEAICFGWIDSLVKRIDAESYARKFTRRRPGSVWSSINKARASKAMTDGLMTEHGLRLVRIAMESGEWDRPPERVEIDAEAPPPELAEALSGNSRASEFFESLPRSCRKRYVTWVAVAKRVETRVRRAAEAAEMLARGERLGLK